MCSEYALATSVAVVLLLKRGLEVMVLGWTMECLRNIMYRLEIA